LEGGAFTPTNSSVEIIRTIIQMERKRDEKKRRKKTCFK